ncbi:12381_t:CDS:2 [Entrophospora sp. SA101]|nr:12381_t:CDS:2 [Entrophospora sp. SA101]
MILGSKVESIEYVLEPRSNEKPDKDYEEIFIEENNSVANQGSIHHTEANPTSYIAWRVVDSARVLELRQFLIPSKNIASNLNHISQPGDTTPVIRIKFSSIIVPNVGFITDPITRSLHCVLLLSSKMLYQLELPLDTLFTKRNLMEYYDVRAKVRSLKEKIPALVHVIDNENIIIGCTNGSVIHLKQTETIKKKPGFNKMDDCFDELEFKDNSYYKFMNNLLGARPMIFGGNNDQLISPLQPVSMDSYVCGTKGYIIYICRNRKVVICCLNTHSYISHDPLAEIRPQNDILELLGRDDNIAIHQITAEFDDNPLLPPNSRGYVRILNFNKHPSSFFFMVSVPTTFNCYFITYIVNVDTSGVLKDAKVAGVTSFNHYHKFDSNQSSNTKLIDMSLKFQQIYKPPPPPPPNEYQENQQVTLIEDEKLEYDCRLWALWEHDKQSVVSFVDFQVLYYPSRHNNRSSELIGELPKQIDIEVVKYILSDLNTTTRTKILSYLIMRKAEFLDVSLLLTYVLEIVSSTTSSTTITWSNLATDHDKKAIKILSKQYSLIFFKKLTSSSNSGEISLNSKNSLHYVNIINSLLSLSPDNELIKTLNQIIDNYSTIEFNLNQLTIIEYYLNCDVDDGSFNSGPYKFIRG